MARVYTHGTWIVVPGREEEFVALWRDLAEWTRELSPDARGTLLRDRAQPNRFHSFGPWENEETVAQWRAEPGFRERVARIEPLLESFEPRVMDPLVEPGDE